MTSENPEETFKVTDRRGRVRDDEPAPAAPRARPGRTPSPSGPGGRESPSVT